MSAQPTPQDNYAALNERVTGLGSDVDSLRKDVHGIRNVMASADAVREINTKLEAFGARIEERSKTQWPTLIMGGTFLLAMGGLVGTLAKLPIDATLARHDTERVRFEDKVDARLNGIDARYVQDLKDQIRDLRQPVRGSVGG